MSSRLYRIYVASLAGAAAAALLSLDWSGVVVTSPADWLGLLVFVLLGLMSESLALTIVLGKDVASSSITFILVLAAVLVFGPAVAVVYLAITEAAAEFGIRRRAPVKALFNTCQHVVSATAAGLAFTSLGGVILRVDSQQTLTFVGFVERQFLPFIAFATVLFAVNLFASALWFALKRGEPLLPVLAQLGGRSGTNILYDLAVSPIGVAVAFLYEQLYIGGLLLAVLPLLVIRHAYFTNLRLQQTNRDLLEMMVKAIETRDPYTSGHSRRVATMARRIAELMRLPRKASAAIETAALLHDIGKIDADYAEIIRKPSQLSQEERMVIQCHATRGADLIRSLSSFGDGVVAAVRHHHERYDGRGYPEGLSGEAVPLGARIIMICDSVDAMLSDRPYRGALSLAEVEEELYSGKGTQFDPEIVARVLESDLLERQYQDVLADRAARSDGVRWGVAEQGPRGEFSVAQRAKGG